MYFICNGPHSGSNQFHLETCVEYQLNYRDIQNFSSIIILDSLFLFCGFMFHVANTLNMLHIPSECASPSIILPGLPHPYNSPYHGDTIVMVIVPTLWLVNLPSDVCIGVALILVLMTNTLISI